jgi:hypothetical protein
MAVISGEVQGGRGRTFGSLDGLSDLGYVEREYFVDGEAVRYTLAAGTDYRHDGRWTAEEVERAPFRTRLVARFPEDASRFNGTLVVGWTNVSSGHERLGGGEGATFFDDGFAWVGASVQRVGLEGTTGNGQPRGLKFWDPERYGSLSIPDDDYSYDIFTQIAQAVRHRNGIDVLDGLVPERLLAAGSSQSGVRLSSYFNAIQPLTMAFDAFQMGIISGGGTILDATKPAPSPPELGGQSAGPSPFRILPFGTHQLRDDLPTKVFVLNSETEARWYFPCRQPDTDTFRYWEMAGAAHGSGSSRDAAARDERDFGDAGPRPASSRPEHENTLSTVPVSQAVLWHIQRWMADDIAPPRQPLIEFTGDPPRISRDDYGNALGGVRIPDFAVPLATHIADPPLEGLPAMTGSSEPFSNETLRRLYPTRDDYVREYNAAVDHCLATGAILEREAPALRAKAALVQLP